ncbi:hypothetical protein KDD30_22730 (plasmid) [Photobacterium sp. GJ3]|uniref:hypothetical protein n=1 Tax=Photobacterium sp. GJ3 TaxID=2829502 RepID=UPI001B8B9E5D|nr:hypothetical protein [Photobacterium sp. GJ3]QUJ69562.1 hypothetical protein KDD30_22730 [Photobacterium sp. GJ3]
MRSHRLTYKFLAISLFLCSGQAWADCTTEALNEIRGEALAAYKNQQTDRAAQILNQFYQEGCDLYEMRQASDTVFNQGLWLISDLMFYRQKQGDQLECLSLGNQVYTQWMASTPERHEPKVEKALQTNLRQCQKSLDQQYAKPETCPVKGFENMLAFPKAWQAQDPIYFELRCMRFAENTKNLIGGQRDSEQFRSEGLNDVPSFDVLYVSNVTTTNSELSRLDAIIDEPIIEEEWVNHYALDKLYLKDDDNKMWQTGHCYSFDLRFGNKAGQLYLDGSSSPCIGGSGASLNQLIGHIRFPFSVDILDNKTDVVK